MNILKKCRRALATLLAVGTAFVATAAWAATPLSAPTWTEVESKDNCIRFAWNKVEGAAKYRIEKQTNGVWSAIPYTTSNTSFGWKCKYKSKSPFTYDSETFRVVAISSTGAESTASSPFTVRLAAGTPYFYVVGASAGATGVTTTSAYVQPVSNFDESVEKQGRKYVSYFSGGAPNPTPNPKQPLPTPTWTSQSVSGTQIKLEWSKVAEAQNYTLYSKETTAANFTQRVVYGNSTTFNGVKNKSYDFYVVANPKYNANYDKSAASETKTVELSGGGGSNPEDPNPAEGADWRPRVVWNWAGSSSIRITVSWDPVPNAKRYRINVDGRWYETTAPNYTFTESVYYNGNWPNSAYGVAILTDGSEVTSKTYNKSEIENMVEY